MRFEVERPDGLADSAWQSLSANLERLRDAYEKDDRALAIGTAKDLAESVARMVLEAGGDVAESSLDFNALVTRAHMKLRRQPGPELTSDETVRNIAGGAKTIVSQLPEIRNRYGTGHGRTVVPNVSDELFGVSVDASLLWSRWALRRLECLIAGWPNKLVSDLRDGEIFRSTDLLKRLWQADLPNLEEPQQHLLGLAVAQRASTGTFTVATDGIERCISDPDPGNWPAGYRAGLVEGIFLNRDGEVAPEPRFIAMVAEILKFHPAPEVVLHALAKKVSAARLAWHLRNDIERKESVISRMNVESQKFPTEPASSAWNALTAAVVSFLDNVQVDA